MNKPWARFWKIFAACLVLGVVIAEFEEPRHRRRPDTPRFQMREKLYRIGFALVRFRREHGAFPQNLSELCPRFLTKSQLDCFSAPGSPKIDFTRMADADIQRFIDTSPLFEYSSTGWNDGTIIAYEREGPWNTGPQGYPARITLHPDGSAVSEDLRTLGLR